MKKNCEVCNKEFDVRPSTYNRRKTCSKECFSAYKTDKIECNCYICDKELFKTKSQIGKSKSGRVFCSSKCVGVYNAETRRQDIFKNCVICGLEFKTIKAREGTHITCSNECQGKWQSKFRVGENASNYRGGGDEKICKNCGNSYITDNPYQSKTRKFCSKDCKNSYWAKNTLHNEEFKKSHYEGNLKFRKEHGETLPEKIVRGYLESAGLVKDKDFFQERGFFHKYFADFYIPKTKTIIEVNGDFWHGNPSIYGDREDLIPLYESQKQRMIKDREKENDFIKFGFNYYVLWESDIYEDVYEVIKDIKIQ